MQIKYINRALQRFGATEVIPTQFVMFTLSVIIGSAVLYRDFEKTPGDAAGKFIGGCAMTFLGVWLITSARSRDEDEGESEAEPTEADSIRLRQDERLRNGFKTANSSHRASLISTTGHPDERRLSLLRDGIQSLPQTPTSLPADTPLTLSPKISREGLNGASPTQFDTTGLTDNPWASSKDSLFSTAPPPLKSTSSAPLLPSEVQSTAHSELLATPNLSPEPGPTPLPTLPHQPPHLATTPALERPSTFSVANLLGGPLLNINPLTASLSAAAADSLRKATWRTQRSNPRNVGTWGPGDPRSGRIGRDRGSSDADVLGTSSIWADDEDSDENGVAGAASPRLRANSTGGFASIIDFFKTPTKKRNDTHGAGAGAGADGNARDGVGRSSTTRSAEDVGRS